MADLSLILNNVLELDGAISAALVDSQCGMLLASVGRGIDIEIAAAGSSQLVRAEMKTASLLRNNDEIIDILITLKKQYHILRPLSKVSGIFIYLVLDSSRGNLALARRKVSDIDGLIDSI